jgi:hypothetical protein
MYVMTVVPVQKNRLCRFYLGGGDSFCLARIITVV